MTHPGHTGGAGGTCNTLVSSIFLTHSHTHRQHTHTYTYTNTLTHTHMEMGGTSSHLLGLVCCD